MTGRRCGSTSTGRRSRRRPHRRDLDIDQPVADRRRQPLRAVLRRLDRQRPRLQRRADRRPDPDRRDDLNQRHGSDTTPPSQPGTLTATAVSGAEVDLSWGASTDNVGVTRLLVERCSGAGCSNFAQIATAAGTGTGYKDTTSAPSTSYSYRVRATDAAGNLSAYSNTASATPRRPTRPRRRSRERCRATAVSGGEIDLSWGASTDNVGVTGYRSSAARASAAATSPRSPPRPAPAPATRTRPSARRPATATGCARSTPPATSAVLEHGHAPPTPDTTPPSQPGTLCATAVSSGEIDLSWGASTDNVGVTGYRVERCSGRRLQQLHPDRAPRPAPAPATRTRPSAPSTSYSYRVRAIDAAGNHSAVLEHRQRHHPGGAVGSGGGVRVR